MTIALLGHCLILVFKFVEVVSVFFSAYINKFYNCLCFACKQFRQNTMACLKSKNILLVVFVCGLIDLYPSILVLILIMNAYYRFLKLKLTKTVMFYIYLQCWKVFRLNEISSLKYVSNDEKIPLQLIIIYKNEMWYDHRRDNYFSKTVCS